jgi:hypothetical protein
VTQAVTWTYSGDQVNAGTYTATATYDGDANHEGSVGSATMTITKATSTTTTIGAGPFTYNGSPQVGGWGTVTGANLSTSATSVTYSANPDGTGTADLTNAGTYYVTAHYAGDLNHLPSDGAAVAVTIGKASSTTTVTGGTFTYTGTPHGAISSSVTGDGNLNTTATSFAYYVGSTLFEGIPTNAGTYTVVATYAGDANHEASSSAPATITIDKAPMTVTVTSVTKTYDGLAYGGGTVTYSGFVNNETSSVLGGSLQYGGTSQGAINAGTYSITASGLTSGNYAITYVAGSLTVNARQLAGTATTQNALNVAKAGSISFAVAVNTTGLAAVDAANLNAVYDLFNGACFTIKVNGNLYTTTATASVVAGSNTVTVSIQMNGALQSALLGILGGVQTTQPNGLDVDFDISGNSTGLQNYLLTSTAESTLFWQGKLKVFNDANA